MFIINAGAGFKMVWSTVRRILDQRTTSKIHVKSCLHLYKFLNVLKMKLSYSLFYFSGVGQQIPQQVDGTCRFQVEFLLFYCCFVASHNKITYNIWFLKLISVPFFAANCLLL